jgi:hypothetical protein
MSKGRTQHDARLYGLDESIADLAAAKPTPIRTSGTPARSLRANFNPSSVTGGRGWVETLSRASLHQAMNGEL